MAVMGGSVARRYARALFGIGVDARRFEALGAELKELATLWNDSDELRQALENPVFRPAEKRAVLESILPRVAPTPEVPPIGPTAVTVGGVVSGPMLVLKTGSTK